jgi:hypothetical protein
VAEKNEPPVWVATANRRVTEGLQLTFTLKATDADLPVQTLKFTLVSGPEGLTVSTNGVLNWQPTEAQGPSTNRVTVTVTDGVVAVPQEFDVVVLESNRLPVWTNLIPTRRVAEGLLLTFNVQATDGDIPVQPLSYRLVSGPTGLVVTTNGAVSWRPTEEQGPSTNRVKIGVSDGVASVAQEFDIIVAEKNEPPVWVATANRRVTEGLQLTFTLKATDADLPAQTLKYSFVQGPTGLTVSTNGVLTWKPTEAQGPSTNRVQVSVSDGFVSVPQEFTIVVLASTTVQPKLSLVVSSPGGGFELVLFAPLGSRHVLQQRATLSGPWTPVINATNPIIGAGMSVPVSVKIPAPAPTNNSFFYQIVKP